MASTDQRVPTTFKCEEIDEYLLIEDAGTPDQDSGTSEQDAGTLQGPEAKDVTEPRCKERISSSPKVEKPNDSTVEPEEEEEEWCIVEQEKHRPQGLYGYRYVDYDDEDAEGNIHITDEDL